jgi:preprotein translocase subunit YajC
MPADWMPQLMSWLPFIVLMLVFLFFAQRAGGTRWNRMNEFYEAQVTEMQRTNALLNRIAVALEKRGETSA